MTSYQIKFWYHIKIQKRFKDKKREKKKKFSSWILFKIDTTPLEFT